MAHSKKKPAISKEQVKEKLREKKKLSKILLKEKRARLIVKNLPFKATEENLKEYFEKYGEISSVELLKKPDGKLVGCGFIQFKLVQKAAKAQHHTNKKPFLGRNIIVDFAKAKNKYEKQKKDEAKKEETKTDSQELKSEDIIEIKDEPTELKEEEVKEEADDVNEDVLASDSENEDSAESEESENEPEPIKQEAPHRFSNDVSEGKTIFIKNVPFDATNEDLKQCMLQFGRVYYALVCVDKMTEHSKGTAFVKFINKEDADKALSAGTELTLLGNILDCHPALDRNKLQEKVIQEKEDKKKPKDSRNLYLVKEGVILAGTKAAEGVSASDMAKRLQLEQYKTQMLRNLNMFVSRDRLIVHNLPSTWDDKKLKTLFQKYGGPGALIKEARIMRDMRKLNAEGIGVSKEYGFVSFSKHENALTALRSLNNNPEIFSVGRRPIIAFSIENKAMLKAKVKRLEKSKLKNPQANTFEKNNSRRERNKSKKNPANQINKPDNTDTVEEKFTGVTAKPGTQPKMRGRYKLQVQAKLHRETLKKEKNKRKSAKKSLEEKKRDFTKQDKQKVNKRKNAEDDFSKIVSSYKKKLSDIPTAKKAKWYS